MKSILILDNLNAECLKAALLAAADKYGLDREINIDISRDSCLRHLPINYDLYLLHFSNTTIEAINELKEMQLWSIVIVISGAVFDRPTSIDRIYYILNENDYINILERMGLQINDIY